MKRLPAYLFKPYQQSLEYHSDLIVAAMRDRASVNSVAMSTIRVLYNRIFDVGCFSHTLNHVGEHMNTPVLNDFIKTWINMFSHSPKTRLKWTTLTGLPPPRYCATRWWSKFEAIHQVHNTFGDIVPFLTDTDLPATSSENSMRF